MSTEADWSQVTERHGVPEVTVQWVANYAEGFRLVDVREPSELVGPLGRLEGAVNIPLRTLIDAVASWERDEPVVVFCRSGGRSAQAAMAMKQMGFTQVASMAGGMLEWGAHHLPVL